jgi:hypothetical protein
LFSVRRILVDHLHERGAEVVRRGGQRGIDQAVVAMEQLARSRSIEPHVLAARRARQRTVGAQAQRRA